MTVQEVERAKKIALEMMDKYWLDNKNTIATSQLAILLSGTVSSIITYFVSGHTVFSICSAIGVFLFSIVVAIIYGFQCMQKGIGDCTDEAIKFVVNEAVQDTNNVSKMED